MVEYARRWARGACDVWEVRGCGAALVESRARGKCEARGTLWRKKRQTERPSFVSLVICSDARPKTMTQCLLPQRAEKKARVRPSAGKAASTSESPAARDQLGTVAAQW